MSRVGSPWRSRRGRHRPRHGNRSSIEREFRVLIADPSPITGLGEVLRPVGARPDGGFRWLFDPIDGTTNFAHGLPIFCSSLALELDGVAMVAAVYDPIGASCSPQNGVVARGSTAHRCASRPPRRSSMRCSARVPVQRPAEAGRARRAVRTFSGISRAVRRLARRRSISVTSRRGGSTASGKCTSPVDISAGALIVRGGAVSQARTETPFAVAPREHLATNGPLTTHAGGLRAFEAGFRSRIGRSDFLQDTSLSTPTSNSPTTKKSQQSSTLAVLRSFAPAWELAVWKWGVSCLASFLSAGPAVRPESPCG